MNSANDILAAALGRLEAADGHLSTLVKLPRSLDPERERATSLRAIGSVCLKPEHGAEVINAFTETLSAVADAQVEHFPENIFWDLDFLGTSMLAGALRGEGDAVSHLNELGDRVVRLMRIFGRQSSIRFRYVHDFMYGFDWAKWVAKAPLEREHVGPFDITFLTYMEKRAYELFELISNEDTKYPRLRDERYRNPFSFIRNPEHEIRLFGDLAQRKLIPVETWRLDARPKWSLPFADLRAARAEELGLPRNC